MVNICGQDFGTNYLDSCGCGTDVALLWHFLAKGPAKNCSCNIFTQIQKGGIVGEGSGSADNLTEEEFDLDKIPVYP